MLQPATQGYDEGMDIPVRELRNDTAAVLRRVAAGEDVTITVHGQPVARLVPAAAHRRRPIAREEFLADLAKWQADPGLRHELRELAGEMTDENDVEW